MASITTNVNGQEVRAEVENRTLLVQFLREHLGLTGTHVGCDTSQCGACVVQVNGLAVKSCTMLAAEVIGVKVVTIEGMASEDGSLGVIQQAFRDNHGLQCGFCTSGMVMSTAGLLKTNKNPSEVEIRKHLQGNFCRCTGYQNIVKSIQAAAAKMS